MRKKGGLPPGNLAYTNPPPITYIVLVRALFVWPYYCNRPSASGGTVRGVWAYLLGESVGGSGYTKTPKGIGGCNLLYHLVWGCVGSVCLGLPWRPA